MTIPDRLHDNIPRGSVMVMSKDPVSSLDYSLEFYPPDAVPANIKVGLTRKLPGGGGSTTRFYGWL